MTEQIEANEKLIALLEKLVVSETPISRLPYVTMTTATRDKVIARLREAITEAQERQAATDAKQAATHLRELEQHIRELEGALRIFHEVDVRTMRQAIRWFDEHTPIAADSVSCALTNEMQKEQHLLTLRQAANVLGTALAADPSKEGAR